MTAELAVGVGALELVPGDPEELGRLAARLSVLGDGMSDAGTKLGDVEAAGWRGPAADAFQGLVGEQPAKYRTAGSAFGHAVGAIRTYAAVLRRAQADAGRAVSMFEDADRESEQWRRSRASHDSAVRSAQAAGDPPPSGPSPPASDPAGADRAASQSLLADARSAVRAQGQIAASALSAAADEAPKEPGLLDSAIGGIGDFFGGVGDGLSAAWTATTGALSDAAGWVKGAFEQYGASVLKIAAGALAIVVGVELVVVGVAMAGVGLAADATGVGVVVGVPLNLAGVAVAGAGLVLIVGGGALLMEGASDLGDDIEESGSDSDAAAAEQTNEALDQIGDRIDNIKEHVTERDLDAARRELDGEVVARKPDGTPYDHVQEVRDAQNGLVNQIDRLKGLLDRPGLSEAQRAEAERRLGEASRILDHTEEFVPRP